MKRNIVVFIIILLAAVLVYGMYFFFTQDWRGNNNLTYVNTEHGYSFQYNSQWHLIGDAKADVIQLYNTDDPPGDGGIPVGIKVDIMALKNDDNLDLESWLGQLGDGQVQQPLTQENVSVAGLDAVRKTMGPYTDSIEEGSPISIYFINGDYIFAINYLGREPDYSAQMGNFELILKTLNFN